MVVMHILVNCQSYVMETNSRLPLRMWASAWNNANLLGTYLRLNYKGEAIAGFLVWNSEC